jgi:hypothetical protein
MHEVTCLANKGKLLSTMVQELGEALLDKNFTREADLRMAMFIAWGQGVAAFDGSAYGRN